MFCLLQALLNGPHTKVRVDAALSPEKHAKPGKGGLQTGLSKFYKGKRDYCNTSQPLRSILKNVRGITKVHLAVMTSWEKPACEIESRNGL